MMTLMLMLITKENVTTMLPISTASGHSLRCRELSFHYVQREILSILKTVAIDNRHVLFRNFSTATFSTIIELLRTLMVYL